MTPRWPQGEPKDSGSRTQGSGLRVLDSMFRSQGSGLKVRDSGFRTQGSALRVQDTRFGTQGSGLEVRDSGLRTQGSELSRNYFGIIPDLYRNCPGFVLDWEGIARAEHDTSPAEDGTSGAWNYLRINTELSRIFSRNYSDGAVSGLWLRTSLPMRRGPG